MLVILLGIGAEGKQRAQRAMARLRGTASGETIDA
jgi:hypothetical protein